MSELKLRRLMEHNQRLREDLTRPRVKVSEASARCVLSPLSPSSPFILTLIHPLNPPSLIRYCKQTKDHLVRRAPFLSLPLPSHAIYIPLEIYPFPNQPTPPFQVPSVWGPVGKGEDPYAPPAQGCNCSIM